MRTKQKYLSKTFLLSFFSFWYILITLVAVVGIITSFRLISNTTIEYVPKYQKLDGDAEKIIKSRTLSLFFAQKKGSFEYQGTYGTAWVIPNGIKQVDNNTLNCYIATNIHVISSFVNVITNKAKTNLDYSYSLNNNFNYLFFSYFDSENQQKLHGLNTDEREFIEKKDVEVLKMFAGQDETQKYQIDNLNFDEGINSIGPFEKIDNKWYLKNFLHDIAILRLQITRNKNNLYKFMNNINLEDKNRKISLITVNEMKTLKDNIESFYIGGFPYLNQQLKWKGYTIPFDNGNNSILSSSSERDNSFKSPNAGINFQQDGKLENFKNVSRQILIKNLNIGSGSSGSMMLAKLKDQTCRILGICWGVYETSRSLDAWEAADLLVWQQEDNVTNTTYSWPSYDLTSEINNIINNDEKNK